MLFLLTAVSPIVVILGNGFDNYIARDFYLLGARGSIIGTLGVPLITASMLMSGYLFGASKTSGGRLLALLLTALGLSVLFAQSSRTFALAPILFAVGFALSSPHKNRGWSIGIAAALSALLLPLPLIFRGQPLQGLIPNLETLRALRFSDIDWLSPLNNVLISFPLIGESAYGGHGITTSDLLISLNPLPGQAIGWADVSRHLRLNAYTPTAAIGEIGALGLPTVLLVFGLLGVALAWFERSIGKIIQQQQLIFAAIELALIALFATQMIQYNFRSGVRLLLYAFLIEIARRILQRTHAAVSRPTREVPPRRPFT